MNIDEYVLVATLAFLAVVMTAGCLYLKQLIRSTNDQILPIYAKNVQQNRALTESSLTITKDLVANLSLVTAAMEQLQQVVQKELLTKPPVMTSNETQTEPIVEDSLTVVTPLDLISDYSWRDSSSSVCTVTSATHVPVARTKRSVDTSTASMTSRILINVASAGSTDDEVESLPMDEGLPAPLPSPEIILQMEDP